MHSGNFIDGPTHAQIRGIHFANEPKLPNLVTISHCNGIVILGDINSDENFCMLSHGLYALP